MTKDQFAQEFHISIDTLESWMKDGFPHFKKGNVVRIYRTQAEVWIKQFFVGLNFKK